MAQPVEVMLQCFQAFFRHNQLPLHVTIPVLVVCNSADESTLGHTILGITIPTLLGFLQIQSAGKNEPFPFQAHSLTTMTSVFSVVIYYLAFRARIGFPAYASQLGIVMAITSSVSVASLVSLLLPHSWWFVRFILYLLLLVAELHQFLKGIFDKYVGRFLHSEQSWHMITEPQRLPQINLETRVDGNTYWRAQHMIAAPGRPVANLAEIITQ